MERPGLLVGAAAAFLEQAGVVNDGRQEACEPAVHAALRARLDDPPVRALADTGRSLAV